MQRKTWKKHHKWLGIGFCFFMLMFCISGVILNHRSLVAHMDISRKWLPSSYEYSNWNGGLLRGTTQAGERVVIYGNNGLWLADRNGKEIEDFNDGLPQGADYRQIRHVVKTRGSLFAVSPFALYRYDVHNLWHTVSMPLEDGERFTDIAVHGDSLVVLSRDRAYLALPPYTAFKPILLQKPDGYTGSVTAFRTVWLLHSGELFGTTGILVADAIAIILVLLCFTGLAYWLIPKAIKKGAFLRCQCQAMKVLTAMQSTLKWSYILHKGIGRYTIVLTLFICVTGWCLRPPVMIPLALTKVPALPFTTLKSDNPWHDRLRMLRYDDAAGDWLLSTSDGMFCLKNLHAQPVSVSDAPPVSVMGLNVLEKDRQGRWICGSFSGLFLWDRTTGTATDYFTHQPAPRTKGMPFGKKAIAGFSDDFTCKPFAVEHYAGTTAIAQPEALALLPMSLWNVALELHSGRLYIGSIATYIFILITGILAVWCLWSGYKLCRRKGK